MKKIKTGLTSSHWGAGVVHTQEGRIISVDPHPSDPTPSKINENIASSLNGDARVLRPAIRKSWLENGPTDRSVERGRDAFVEVSWDKALELLAVELKRVRSIHGNESIYAGSYGWSSAGRFHHAQSLLKRFLNTQGGFVRSVGNYSYNAALVLMPHIVGDFRTHVAQTTRWNVIEKHSNLVVMFGGIAERNTQVSDGGISKHRSTNNIRACAQAGVSFVNLSPIRTDFMDELNGEWLPPNPGSDTAIMMGIAYTLLTENLHDQDFLDKYTEGFDKVAAYLLGETDGIVKNADWASIQSGLSAEKITKLARQMAAGRTMICTAAGVQRTDYGEQPLWMTVTLASMLGQIGLPGGGYTIGYGANGNIGNIERLFRAGTMSQGKNDVKEFIPVAMISDMLLNPNQTYSYNGQLKQFPDIKLIWWAGGNPFHHHQDLNRLRKAFQKPDTIIVNEMNWTSTARHADIILPVAAPQERTDFGAGKSDDALIPMPAHVMPAGSAMIEYDIYVKLAQAMGSQEAYTEGRSADDWLHELWDVTKKNGLDAGVKLPDWDDFIKGDIVSFPDPSPDQVFLAEFRDDPLTHPLSTPSGKIELYSEIIASFNLDDCHGHASWFKPRDLQSGEEKVHPLYLLSGQPKTRLHSQLDNGDYSKSHKINGREPVLIHPEDALSRGIKNGEIVELFNNRGCCLAGAKITDEVKKGCVFLWTGAWYDPDHNAPAQRDRHGNPNVLTHDMRTSSLSQSPAAHSTLVDVKKFIGMPDSITVHEAPKFVV